MEPTIIPPFLVPGDTVGLVATARHINPQLLAKGVEIIEAQGFKIRKASNLHEEDCQFAGNDELRASEFQRMLEDPEIKAILSVRGGYGTVRMVDRVDWSALRKWPKWICGYSDVTVLLNHLGENVNMAALHSSMPVSFGVNSREAIESLFHFLKGGKSIDYPADIVVDGTAKGRITGGNLSVIYSQLGSASQIDTRGKILFLEDVDEHLYHIDRMIQGLKRAGMFAQITGLIVGGMTQMRDNTMEFGFDFDNPFGYSIREIIIPHVPDGVPVCFDVPVGHQDDNRTLMFNVEAEVELQGDNLLINY